MFKSFLLNAIQNYENETDSLLWTLRRTLQ